MLALVLRGFLQRKLRVLLTGIAIALGVALMAGTYILTDTINHSFAGSLRHRLRKQGGRRHRPRKRSAQARLADLADQRSDARAGARGARRGRRLGRDLRAGRRCSTTDGKRLTTGGAPAFVDSEAAAALRGLHRVAGPPPDAPPSEVAIDQATAEARRT